MKNPAAWLLLGLVGLSSVRGDEPKTKGATPRVLEGTITALGSPVKGARVFLGPADKGLLLVEGVTTDDRGHFRAELDKIPSSAERVRVLVLAPGCKVGDQTIEPGALANFELAAEPWKEIEVRMQDSSGRPVAGEEITCSLGGMEWSRYKTDALGGCRVAMAREVGISLSAKPKDARPIEAYLAGTDADPASITLPLLPAIRGRVLDPEGRPVPDVAVGRWVTFGDDGVGQMLPLIGGAIAVTGRDGDFVIAPQLTLRFYWSRPAPKLEGLCFAAPTFRSSSYQLFQPNRPIRIAYQFYDPTRPVEPLTVTLKQPRRVRIPVSWGFVTAGRRTQLYSENSINPRKDIPDWRFFLITRDVKAPDESPTEWDKTVLEEFLPEGTYQLEVVLEDEKSSKTLGKVRGEIVVPPGEGPLDLPPLVLGQTEHQKLAGKPAPEIDATDLETGQPVKLSDFRGKVVVLDFWGYWCGPCVGSMPYLVELSKKFAGRPLEILALHDESVQSRAGYDRRIASARQRMWGGRDLPFRVLLDRPESKKPDDRMPEGNGTSIKCYEITGFPTLFVIDADGTIVEQVPHWQHDRLESLVRKLVEKAEAK